MRACLKLYWLLRRFERAFIFLENISKMFEKYTAVTSTEVFALWLWEVDKIMAGEAPET
jgi:hypothetical protein